MHKRNPSALEVSVLAMKDALDRPASEPGPIRPAPHWWVECLLALHALHSRLVLEEFLELLWRSRAYLIAGPALAEGQAAGQRPQAAVKVRTGFLKGFFGGCLLRFVSGGPRSEAYDFE